MTHGVNGDNDGVNGANLDPNHLHASLNKIRVCGNRVVEKNICTNIQHISSAGGNGALAPHRKILQNTVNLKPLNLDNCNARHVQCAHS